MLKKESGIGIKRLFPIIMKKACDHMWSRSIESLSERLASDDFANLICLEAGTADLYPFRATFNADSDFV